MKKFGIGQSIRRVEDVRLLTGEGCYTDDIRPEGAAFGAVHLAYRGTRDRLGLELIEQV